MLTAGAPAARRKTSVAERPAGLRVLIADADPTTRAAREQQLRAIGHHVSLARTSFEAIVKASCQIPDVILLDSGLTGMNAAETGQLLTTCPMTAHIPVVRLAPGRLVPQRVVAAMRRRAR